MSIDSVIATQVRLTLDYALQKVKDESVSFEDILNDVTDRLANISADYHRATAPRKPDKIMDHIATLCASFFGVSVAEMKSGSRSRPRCRARHVAQYLQNEYADKTMIEIGQYWGGRDHSTVCHAVQNIENRMIAVPAFQVQVAHLREMVIEFIEEGVGV